jgi:hypothetical protein
MALKGALYGKGSAKNEALLQRKPMRHLRLTITKVIR